MYGHKQACNGRARIWGPIVPAARCSVQEVETGRVQTGRAWFRGLRLYCPRHTSTQRRRRRLTRAQEHYGASQWAGAGSERWLAAHSDREAVQASKVTRVHRYCAKRDGSGSLKGRGSVGGSRLGHSEAASCSIKEQKRVSRGAACAPGGRGALQGSKVGKEGPETGDSRAGTGGNDEGGRRGDSCAVPHRVHASPAVIHRKTIARKKSVCLCVTESHGTTRAGGVA